MKGILQDERRGFNKYKLNYPGLVCTSIGNAKNVITCLST